MKILKRFWLVAVLLLGATGCATTGGEGVPVGETLYTQVNMYSLKGQIVTWVNYHVDSLIPINTAVVVDDIGSSSVTFTIKDTGQTLELKNKSRHSGLSGAQWAEKHFAAPRVDLTKFNAAERQAIKDAKVETGMSKAAVLAAYGYPPAHKTPSLDSDAWNYWVTKWNRIVVKFGADGRVDQVVD
jgi:hypothetical protein